jgi:hypothetical protein
MRIARTPEKWPGQKDRWQKAVTSACATPGRAHALAVGSRVWQLQCGQLRRRPGPAVLSFKIGPGGTHSTHAPMSSHRVTGTLFPVGTGDHPIAPGGGAPFVRPSPVISQVF